MDQLLSLYSTRHEQVYFRSLQGDQRGMRQYPTVHVKLVKSNRKSVQKMEDLMRSLGGWDKVSNQKIEGTKIKYNKWSREYETDQSEVASCSVPVAHILRNSGEAINPQVWQAQRNGLLRYLAIGATGFAATAAFGGPGLVCLGVCTTINFAWNMTQYTINPTPNGEKNQAFFSIPTPDKVYHLRLKQDVTKKSRIVTPNKVEDLRCEICR